MGSWWYGHLSFIVILLLSSLWFIWNNSFCQILAHARYTSTASNVRNLPIIPGLLYCIVTVDLRKSDCYVTIRSVHAVCLYYSTPPGSPWGCRVWCPPLRGTRCPECPWRPRCSSSGSSHPPPPHPAVHSPHSCPQPSHNWHLDQQDIWNIRVQYYL